ncbi:hypothetical protein HY469_00385 [Candidatus Roizmanbacteria bacterium]|nr:hypothetical protein [Candidatus Roizmanbacteria bacterium]
MKIYFWIILILSILGIPLVLVHSSAFTLNDWRGLAESILIIIAPFSYAFGKRLFDSQIWKVLFWYTVVFWSLDALYVFIPDINLDGLNRLFVSGLPESISNSFGVILSIVFGLPALYAMYKLAYGKKK